MFLLLKYSTNLKTMQSTIKCCVMGCYSRRGQKTENTNQDIWFAFFPRTDEIEFERWKSVVPKCPSKKPFNFGGQYAVCSLHFPPDSFIIEDRYTINGELVVFPKDKIRLKKGLLPSIFDNEEIRKWKEKIREFQCNVALPRCDEDPTLSHLISNPIQDPSAIDNDDISNIIIPDPETDTSTSPSSSTLTTEIMTYRLVDDFLQTLKPVPRFDEELVYDKLTKYDFQNWSIMNRKDSVVAFHINCDDFNDKKIKIFPDLSIEVYAGKIRVKIEKFSSVEQYQHLKMLTSIVEQMLICLNCHNPSPNSKCLGFRHKSVNGLCSNCCCEESARRSSAKRKLDSETRMKQKRQKLFKQLKRQNTNLTKRVDKLLAMINGTKDKNKKGDSDLFAFIEDCPLIQQENIKACLNAARVKHSKSIRYSNDWLYHCLELKAQLKSGYKTLFDMNIMALPREATLLNYAHRVKVLVKSFSEVSAEESHTFKSIDGTIQEIEDINELCELTEDNLDEEPLEDEMVPLIEVMDDMDDEEELFDEDMDDMDENMDLMLEI